MVSTPQLLQLALGVAGVPLIIVMTVSVRFSGNGSRTLGLASLVLKGTHYIINATILILKGWFCFDVMIVFML